MLYQFGRRPPCVAPPTPGFPLPRGGLVLRSRFVALFQLVTPAAAGFGVFRAIMPFSAKYHNGSSNFALNITAISFRGGTLSNDFAQRREAFGRLLTDTIRTGGRRLSTPRVSYSGHRRPGMNRALPPQAPPAGRRAGGRSCLGHMSRHSDGSPLPTTSRPSPTISAGTCEVKGSV